MVNVVEGLWIALGLTAFALTFTALVDARASQKAVKALNGKAREIAADGIVRREVIRLIVQSLLLSLVIPGLFSDAETPFFNPFVLTLMGVQGMILLSTVLDGRDRKALTMVVAGELLNVQTSALNRIEEKLDANTEISQKASDHADAAYHEANSVNLKIAAQGEALITQGEELAADRKDRAEAEAPVIATIDDTHSKVEDLHDALGS